MRALLRRLEALSWMILLSVVALSTSAGMEVSATESGGGTGSGGATGPVEATLRLHPTRALGLDPEGRLRLYAPDFPVGGNPASHWDPWAFPDLLMEPAVTPGRKVTDVDLTLPALEDLGWGRGESRITLRFDDAPGEGFHHPELGEARRRAMSFAAEIWSGLLASGVEIEAAVSFDPLVCAPNAGVLAQADTSFLFEGFPAAPRPDTWYPGALAEALSGVDLSAEDPQRGSEADLFLQFNSDIDRECIFPGAGFYYGLDSTLPPGKFSFVATALHELAHGLGFGSRVDRKSGELFEGLPDVYSTHLFDRLFGRSWPQLTARERQRSRGHGGDLVWSGEQVNAAARQRLMPAAQLVLDRPLPGGLHRLLAAPALFGPPLDRQGLRGQLMLALDASPRPTLACGPLANAGALAGKIAVVDRGVCTFADKARSVQAAGALAVVILDDAPGPPGVMGGTGEGVAIPAVLVEAEAGRLLRRTLVQTGPPFPPRDLEVELESDRRLQLRWRDLSQNEERFRIERRVGDGPFGALGEVEADETAFTDSGLQAGRTYAYRVRAENAAGASPYTEPVSFTLPGAAPPVPTGLEARTESSFAVRLSWDPLPVPADRILVERRIVALRGEDGTLVPIGPERSVARFHQVDSAEGSATEAVVFGLDPDSVWDFRIRARNGEGTSAASRIVTAATLPPPDAETTSCTPAADRLCLLDRRFRVEVLFRDQRSGEATRLASAVPDRRGSAAGAGESGFFWFFRPDNLELVVKVLDATSFAGAHWVFYGGLSDVEYWMLVTDTGTGARRAYRNPPGEICGRADTAAFPGLAGGARTSAGDAASWREGAPLPPTPPLTSPRAGGLVAPGAGSSGAGSSGAGASGACIPGPETLCLLDGRFAVRVGWRDLRSSTEGFGRAVSSGQVTDTSGGSDATGFFWFFDQDNLELVTKVIDGRPVNGHFWFFYGALTDVGYDLEVVDTVTGHRATFTNPTGELCGDARTDAFPAE